MSDRIHGALVLAFFASALGLLAVTVPQIALAIIGAVPIIALIIAVTGGCGNSVFDRSSRVRRRAPITGRASDWLVAGSSEVTGYPLPFEPSGELQAGPRGWGKYYAQPGGGWRFEPSG